MRQGLKFSGIFLLILLAGCTASAMSSPLPTQVATAVPPASTADYTGSSSGALAMPLPPDQALPTETATPTAVPAPPNAIIQPFGTSVQGRPLVAYRFNDGPQHIIFVGGIHGGYEWNTITLAYEAIDYFSTHPEAIPKNVTLHIIPSANPDGQYLVTQSNGRFTPPIAVTDTVPGRFNANGVDLNRNWDCEWAEAAVWRESQVSGGTRPFSEKETVALRDYLLAQTPAVVVFWHSAANGVFAAGCPTTDLPSVTLATIYGQAAGYPVHQRFSSYPVTGDAGDWLTTQGIPSFTVELINHESTDWPQNMAGLTALLNYFRSD